MAQINNMRPEIVGANPDTEASTQENSGGMSISEILRRSAQAVGGFFGDSSRTPTATRSTTPAWLWPVVIGGVGLTAVYVLTKK